MEPTIREKTVITDLEIYKKNQNPERFDIVVYLHPTLNRLIVHRIIGMPNERLLLGEEYVIINSEYLHFPDQMSFIDYLNVGCKVSFPFIIPENHYFVLADEPDVLNWDSRVIGAISFETIKGKIPHPTPLTFFDKVGKRKRHVFSDSDSGSLIHIVRKDETLEDIALLYGVKLGRLKSINNSIEAISPGLKLVIPVE
jgi:signal peptidase I